jgi:hypothetical protein
MRWIITFAALIGMQISGPIMAADWKISKREGAVDLSVTGNITNGERQRFVFRKNHCDQVIHAFSTYTEEPANFDKVVGKNFSIQFNGEKIGAKLGGARKAMMGHLLYFNLGGYSKDALLSHLKKDTKITIKFVDGDGYKASEYFDVPSNNWSIDGISAAFESAYKACTQ